MAGLNKTNAGKSESGNVLFLILIAVALFAALSYAVTQSTRTGGGGGDSETALITSAQLTQYPASVRTAVVRMIIGGTNVGDLEFNSPSNFVNLLNPTVGVFHPEGGGATYTLAPGDMMSVTGGNTTGAWVFNAENQIELLGTTNAGGTPTTSSAEVIAFLPGISVTLCNRINKELGLPATPPTETGIDMTTQMVNTSANTAGHVDICDGGCGGTIGEDVTSLDGRPFGCIEQPAGTYNYYHVLVER